MMTNKTANPTRNSAILYRGALFAALMLAFLTGSLAWAGEWSLKDKEGVRYNLSGLHGKWVLVNFWAPWCPPCVQEIPDLVSLQCHKNLQLIGVAVMYKTRTEVTDMVKNMAIPYPVVLGNEDTAGDFGGISGLPTSFLYTPSGQLAGKHEGPLTKKEVELAIEGKAATLFTR